MGEEIWKPVPTKYGFGYEASSLGRVRSKFRILKGICSKSTNWYVNVSLKSPEGKHINYRAHRIVAFAFGIIDEADIVNHIDGVKWNNAISNLEKSNHSHNHKHAFAMGLNPRQKGEVNGRSKLTLEQAKQVVLQYADGVSAVSISKQFGISASQVSAIALGKRWSELDGLRASLNIRRRNHALKQKGK